MAEQTTLWDGRFAGVPAALNAAPLPAIRSALYEAKSRIDHAIAELGGTETTIGPRFIQAQPLLGEAAELIKGARKLIEAECPGQIARAAALTRAPGVHRNADGSDNHISPPFGTADEA